MATHHVRLTATVPDWILAATEAEDPQRARSRLLSQSWYERRRLDWHCSAAPAPSLDQSPVRHDITLDLGGAEAAEPSAASLTFTFDVAVRGDEDPADKARRLLDLPGVLEASCRAPATQCAFDRGSFSALRGDTVIGPLPRDWPVGRTLTGYSSHLGSYGQGGVGLSGWQCNGGSWIVLPLKYSEGWIWLTHEDIRPADDYRSLRITLDQRILGVHPDQLAAFHPWEHRYVGHDEILDLPDFASQRLEIARFERSASGFVLEAAGGLERWRFAMGDTLPRPCWAGSGEPRLLHAGESIADAFVLTHDCYLDV